METLIHYANMAPSPHNNQPWLFKCDENKIQVRLNPDRLIPSLDPGNRHSVFAIGAALENLVVAAAYHGYRPSLRYFQQRGETDPIAEVEMQSTHLSPGSDDETLFHQIPKRHTNRYPYGRTLLPQSWLEWVTKTADTDHTRLYLLTDPKKLKMVGNLIYEGERLCYETEEIQQAVYRWIRFDRTESQSSKDGLWIRTFGLNSVAAKGAKYLLRWKTLKRLNRFHLNRILARRSERLVRHSPAVGLLTVRKETEQHYLTAGSLFQRLSLYGSEKNIHFHPMSSNLLLSWLIETQPQLFSCNDHPLIHGMIPRFKDLFEVEENESCLLFFRMGFAHPFPHREPRLSATDVTQ